MIGVFLCLLAADGAEANARFFNRRVAPILAKRCVGCHNDELKAANVSFEDRASLSRIVVPGDPDASPLIRAIRRRGDVQMPPGPPLSGRDVATLTEWVRRGAAWGNAWGGKPGKR